MLWCGSGPQNSGASPAVLLEPERRFFGFRGIAFVPGLSLGARL